MAVPIRLPVDLEGAGASCWRESGWRVMAVDPINQRRRNDVESRTAREPRIRAVRVAAMIKWIGGAIVAAIALLALVVSLQPAEFRVARQATINAPAPVVYRLVSDLKAFDTWSPYARRDPAMAKTWKGPVQGLGAVYEWSGNSEVGSGRMEIVDVDENERVTMRLEFFTPFEATNTAEFTMTPVDESTTTVTWSLAGRNDFVGKALGLLMDMDEMVGGDFEKGLAELKRIAEARAR